MRCSLVIISSYVRMFRTSFSENASHGMGERANAERASSEERASKRNPATTQPGLGVDLLRMNRSGVAASTVSIVDRIVTPPLQRRRDIGRHAGSLVVTEEKGSRSTRDLEPLAPSSKRPGGQGLVRRVRAEGPGFDARREMATEDSVVVADPVQSGLDDFPHRGPGPLAGGGGLPLTAPESNRRRELLGDGVQLLAGAVGLPRVVIPFGLVQLVPQRAQPLLVGRLRRPIENRQTLA